MAPLMSVRFLSLFLKVETNQLVFSLLLPPWKRYECERGRYSASPARQLWSKQGRAMKHHSPQHWLNMCTPEPYFCHTTISPQTFKYFAVNLSIQPPFTLQTTFFSVRCKHILNRAELSPRRPLKLQTTPMALEETTAQHLHAPHTLIRLPRAQTNFSCFQTLSLPEPAVAIADVHPSAQDDYDWSRQQAINLYPSLFLRLSSLRVFLSVFLVCLSPHFTLLLFFFFLCWCAEYDEKVKARIALTQRATTQSASDLGEQFIYMFIRLHVVTHETFFFFQCNTTQPSSKHPTPITTNHLLSQLYWLILWHKLLPPDGTLQVNGEQPQRVWLARWCMFLLHSLSRNWTSFSYGAATHSSKARKVIMATLERAVNPSCNCAEQTAELHVRKHNEIHTDNRCVLCVCT